MNDQELSFCDNKPPLVQCSGTLVPSTSFYREAIICCEICPSWFFVLAPLMLTCSIMYTQQINAHWVHQFSCQYPHVPLLSLDHVLLDINTSNVSDVVLLAQGSACWVKTLLPHMSLFEKVIVSISSGSLPEDLNSWNHVSLNSAHAGIVIKGNWTFIFEVLPET